MRLHYHFDVPEDKKVRVVVDTDAKNEADLMQAFHTLMQNKTVIMVAHRLSSITQADQIIYLENGKIIAQGNHQALLQTNAAYQTLWAEYQQAKSWTIH